VLTPGVGFSFPAHSAALRHRTRLAAPHTARPDGVLATVTLRTLVGARTAGHVLRLGPSSSSGRPGRQSSDPLGGLTTSLRTGSGRCLCRA
jgi:hypothetical protein